MDTYFSNPGSRWRTTIAAKSNARLFHVELPEDPEEATYLLKSLYGTHPMTHTADKINPPDEPVHYDHNRIHDIVHEGGFSNHPWRGKAEGQGYMVSVDDPSVAHQVHINDLTPKHVAAHRTAATEHLMHPNRYQGGWLDRSDGTVYLDVSEKAPTEDKAREVAVKERQKAYFHPSSGNDYYLNSHADPLRHEAPDQWAAKYKDIHKKYGHEPPKGYDSFRHLYEPEHAAQKEALAQVHRDVEAAKERLGQPDGMSAFRSR